MAKKKKVKNKLEEPPMDYDVVLAINAKFIDVINLAVSTPKKSKKDGNKGSK